MKTPVADEIYRSFALLYARGHWPRFGEAMAAALPTVLQCFGAEPKVLLDIACGEGSFAVAMARRGMRVTGVDRSAEMLSHAAARASVERVATRLVRVDMRSLCFFSAFDLVTCWYDSLNYLLAESELQRAFAGVFAALKPGGLFVFDMNTIYGLAVLWQRSQASVELDTAGHFLVAMPSYDIERSVASLRLVGFAKHDADWERVDEVHHERGYTMTQIRESIASAGLRELACWGNLREMTEPGPDAGRVWFITQRP
jgi:SAM-dependent methyltransferase